MFSEVKLRDDLTKAKFGYSIKSIKPGSHKPVVVECINCNSVSRKEFRNWSRRHQCLNLVGNKKRCYSCNTFKDLGNFHTNGKLSGGVGKLCKECYNKHPARIKYESQRRSRLKNSIKNGDYKYYIERRMTRKASSVKSDGHMWGLDNEFLVQLWEKQDGKCYYTGVSLLDELSNEVFARWGSPSLDRLDPSKGYVKNNMVWCIYGVNAFKHTLTYKEFMNKLSMIKWRKGDK